MRTFERLFKARDDWHGELKFIDWKKVNPKTGKATKRAITTPGAVDYAGHLAGTSKKQGAIPFPEEDRCYFGCIDVDEYKGFNHQKLITTIKDKNIPGVVTRSTNNGAHIWFFFEKAVPSKKLFFKLKEVLGELELDPKTETFPKQTVLNFDNETQRGSFIFLPYYGKGLDHKNEDWTNECDTYGLDENGEPLSLEQFVEVANKNISKSLNDIKISKKDGPLELSPVVEKPKYANPDVNLNDALKDGPPCLEKIWEMKLKDGEHRDDAMYTYAIFVREAKGSVTVKDLEEFNKTFTEPLSNLNKFIKQVENPKSFYKCTSQPMASNCDKEECLFRKFGIGNHTKEESYFKNFAFVKNWNAVVKFSPDPVLLKPQEATNVMKIEKKVIINGETLSNTFDYWLKNRARKSAVDVQEWQPGKPTFYERDGMHGKVKVYNAFKPTNLKPVEGDIALWEDYLAKRFKDEECNKYIQDFIAHKVQRPDVKTMSNLILYSDTGGTGKSHIDEVVQELLGPHNCVSIDLSDLETGWGDIIINKLWISIEEIHNTGNPRKRIANIIKRLTTVKRMFGNMKYGKFVQAEVYASLMMNSNEQTALSIKEEDRRPFVYHLDNDGIENKKENHIEGDILQEWLAGDDGYAKILNAYQKRDLSEFSPTAWPPQTVAKTEMVEATMGYKYQEVIDAWGNKSWPFTQQSRIYAPQHIAKILKKEKNGIEKLFKSFGCELLTRVEGVEFVIYDRNNDMKVAQVDASTQSISLWTDDPELLALSKISQPLDFMKKYLHPEYLNGKRTFAQDDRVSSELVNKLKKPD